MTSHSSGSHSQQSSLLPTPEDLETPLLSSGPDHNEEEESRLAQLIRQKPEETTLLHEEEEPSPLTPPHHTETVSPEVIRAELFIDNHHSKVSWVVICGATLTVLQCGWIWGSYLSNAWSETHLQVSIPHQYYTTDTVVQSMHLTTLLELYRNTHHYGTLVTVIFTSVVLPCVSLLCHVVWIFEWYRKGGPNHGKCRLILQLSWRLMLVIVWVLVLLDVVTSNISLELTETTVSLHNQVRGGLVSYVMGTAAALGVVLVLRRGGSTHSPPASVPSSTRRVPPPGAFSFPWTEDHIYRPPLLEPAAQGPVISTRRSLEHRKRQWQYRHMLAGEAGLLAAVLLVPALSLPLCSVEYQGLAAAFMPDTHVKVYLLQLPMLLYENGVAAGTAPWRLVVVGTVLFLQVSVVPLLAWGSGMATWWKCQVDGGAAETTRHGTDSGARLFHVTLSWWPAVNGISLAVAILLTVPSLGSLVDSLFLSEDSMAAAAGLCAKVHHYAGQDCLQVQGQLLAGAWAWLGHVVALEVFLGLLASGGQ